MAQPRTGPTAVTGPVQNIVRHAHISREEPLDHVWELHSLGSAADKADRAHRPRGQEAGAELSNSTALTKRGKMWLQKRGQMIPTFVTLPIPARTNTNQGQD